MATSLNSLAGNIPAQLMAALVKTGHWTPVQGLAYAVQVQEPFRRAESLSAVAPYIPQSTFPEFLKVAHQIQDEYCRADVLKSLSERNPELFPEALEAARQIRDEYHRAIALSSLSRPLLAKDCSLDLWQELLHGLARRNRKEFLEDIDRLAAAIETLGGKGTILQVAQAMKEVSQQWL